MLSTHFNVKLENTQRTLNTNRLVSIPFRRTSSCVEVSHLLVSTLCIYLPAQQALLLRKPVMAL